MSYQVLGTRHGAQHSNRKLSVGHRSKHRTSVYHAYTPHVTIQKVSAGSRIESLCSDASEYRNSKYRNRYLVPGMMHCIPIGKDVLDIVSKHRTPMYHAYTYVYITSRNKALEQDTVSKFRFDTSDIELRYIILVHHQRLTLTICFFQDNGKGMI